MRVLKTIIRLRFLRKYGSTASQPTGTKTRRIARARGKIQLGAKVFDALMESKGLVFSTSQLAGINGSRRTHELIPSLGHNARLDNVGIHAHLDDRSKCVTLTATIKSAAATADVDTEAMTAVAIAALTIFDMGKQYKQKVSIQDIELLEAESGRGGDEEKQPMEVRKYDQTPIHNDPVVFHPI